ncbi:MAG: trans-sialidase, partial [Nitrosopumilus sp.]
KGTLPKGMGDTPPQQTTSSDDGKSRAEKLAEYEEDYLKRIEQQRVEKQEEFDRSLEEEAKVRSTASRGTLPKGFEPKPEPEAPKASRGTLPKGF